MSETSRIEVIWGHAILDEGFTTIPNLLMRNFRRLGIEHGEWSLICTLLTYKHDERDPFPSQDTLAEHLCCSRRQVQKWVESLVKKNLLLVGQRFNDKSGQFGNSVYNFKPLIDAALALYDKDEPSGPVENEWKVRYQKPCVPEVRTGKIEPDVPEVRTDTGLEVRTDTRPEVRTKRTSIKTTKSKIKSNRTTTKEPSNSTKAANAKAKHDTKRIVVVVDSEIDDLGFEIESKLGAPIRTLMPMLSQWLKEHGREYIIEKAEIIQGGDWNNPLGAFRKAVEEDWPVIGKKAQTKSSDDDDDFARAEDEWYERSRQSLSGKSSTQHDSRYENFYKLFPDS